MALLIDALILLMLAGVLGYAVMVDRRVRLLMAALREMEPMIASYSQAVDRSEQSARGLAGLARELHEMPKRKAPVAPAAPAGTGPGPRAADKTGRAARARAQAGGVTRVTGKTEMVQGFFDSVRDREK